MAAQLRALLARLKAGWQESDHPRDDAGRFGEGGGGKPEGGKKPLGHGYSESELDDMSPGQRRILAARLGLPTRGQSDEAIREALREPEAAKPPPEKAPAVERLPPEQHKTAVRELLAAAQKGEREGGLDPRGDLAHLPSGPRLEKAQSLVSELVSQHQQSKKVGMGVADLYATMKAKGLELRPEEFRAVLLDAHASERNRLSGWSRMPDDLPRPDLAPVVSGKIMGWVNERADLRKCLARLRSRLKAAWQESDHPRADDGKFGSGGGDKPGTEGGGKAPGDEDNGGMPKKWGEARLGEINTIIAGREYDYYGLRVSTAHPETGEQGRFEIGDELSPSYAWEDDQSTGEELEGTSVWGIQSDEGGATEADVDGIANYHGRWVYLVGSNDWGGHGQDAGEVILRAPKVLAVFDRGPKYG